LALLNKPAAKSSDHEKNPLFPLYGIRYSIFRIFLIDIDFMDEGWSMDVELNCQHQIGAKEK